MAIAKSVNPNGGEDYLSIEACLADNEQDLTDAGGDIFTITCTTGGLASDAGNTLVIDGYTTGAGGYIIITVPTSDRHSGKRDATKFRVTPNDEWSAAIKIDLQHTVLDGLQATNSSGNADNCIWSTVANTTIKNCFLYDTNSKGIYAVTTGHTIFNNFVANMTGDGIAIKGGNVSYCTVINSDGVGIEGQDWDTLTCTNCYAGGSAGDDFGETANGDIDTASCASEDLTADDFDTGIACITGVAPADDAGAYFVDDTADAEDLNIGNVLSDLYEAGEAVGGIATDYKGTARDGATPEIGAHEYVAVGGLSIPIAMHHYKLMATVVIIFLWIL